MKWSYSIIIIIIINIRIIIYFRIIINIVIIISFIIIIDIIISIDIMIIKSYQCKIGREGTLSIGKTTQTHNHTSCEGRRKHENNTIKESRLFRERKGLGI